MLTESALAPDPATAAAAMSGRTVAEMMTGISVSSLRTLSTAPGSVVYASVGAAWRSPHRFNLTSWAGIRAALQLPDNLSPSLNKVAE